MERFIAGDVVVMPFPYADLVNAKRRPALVLAETALGDLIFCQITSQAFRELVEVQISAADFVSGGLQQSSTVRPSNLCTAEPIVILRRVGRLSPAAMQRVRAALRQVLAL